MQAAQTLGMNAFESMHHLRDELSAAGFPILPMA
jgi:hypothetical protein